MDVKVKFADHTIKVEKVGELGTNKVLMVSREGGSSGGGINYSTDEQAIGTWIDGKPLYQKSIELTNTYTVRSTFGTISELDGIASVAKKLISVEAIAYDSYTGSGGNQNRTYNLEWLLNTEDDDVPHIQACSLAYGGETYIYSYGVITVRYTKTSD